MSRVAVTARILLAVLFVSVAIAPLSAQEPAPVEPVEPTPRERFEDLLDRFRRQIEPGLDGLRDLLGDLSGWYPPEVLPNGDILIRRRPRQSPEDAAPVTEPFEL